MEPAHTPPPSYYAAIFTSVRSAADDGYEEMARRMMELARQQPGFLGVDSARGADGLGITVSYWASEADLAAWRRHAEHRIAQEQGRSRWYARYELRVARVERAHGAQGNPGSPAEIGAGPGNTGSAG
ncbi:MAG: antibiotic biosynthesis monooxygenase family protein [Verrucomicrobiota bacterium]